MGDEGEEAEGERELEAAEAETEEAPKLKRKPLVADAVFDIETEWWDRYVLGGILWADGTYRDFGHRSKRALAEAILLTPGICWAHNGGTFDCKWLWDEALDLEAPVKSTCAGARIVRMDVGAARVLDSYALSKINLADLSAGLAEHKIATGLACKCGEDCGGYCAISRRMKPKAFAALRRYLRRDCESLLAALQRLEEWASRPEVDLDLCATVGSSAWRSARRTLNLPDASLTWGEHVFTRRAYFGGRCQVFRPKSRCGWEKDVCQMYPAQLRNVPMPWGKPVRRYGAQAARALARGRPGVYRARVDVPPQHLPPLPYRADGRIHYPTGRFVGVWAGLELLYAKRECGVKVEVIEALVWPRQRKVFAPWIDKLHRLREEAPGGKKGPMGTFCKFLANSLTGKFGSRPEGKRLISDPTEPKACTCKDPAACDGGCGCYQPIDRDGRICSTLRRHLGPECHVEWATTILAAARVEWHKEAVSLDRRLPIAIRGMDLVYADTDSMYTERERTRNDGSKLGQWESKGRYVDFDCRAPKLYSYRRADDLSFALRAKGLSLPKLPKKPARQGKGWRRAECAWRKACEEILTDAWACIEAGADMPCVGIKGLAKGAKSGRFFERETGARCAGRGYGDRILEPRSETTRAPTIAEVRSGAAWKRGRCSTVEENNVLDRRPESPRGRPGPKKSSRIARPMLNSGGKQCPGSSP